MFGGIKRGVFVAKHGALYRQTYGGDITQVQVQLAQAGWPANEFINWYIAANSSLMSFPQFMETMRRWVILDEIDSLEELGNWSQLPNVPTTAPTGLAQWLNEVLRGARDR
jgi:hypothetical protein